MDRIFYNGIIKTMENAYPQVSAVCVRGGIIARMGNDEDMLAYRDEHTELIDLKGRFMLPGFIDSHMHMLHSHNLGLRMNLSECGSYRELMDMLRAEALRIKKEGKPGDWVYGMGFNQDRWSDRKTIPNRLELDEVCGDIPCYIQRCCGHTASHNTKALEIMGLMGEKEETTSRDMKFFEDGSPQGQLFEADAGLVVEFFQCPGVEEFKDWIREETARYARMGLVAVHSDDLNMISPGRDVDIIMQAYKELGEADDMSIRVYEQCRVEDAASLRAFIAKYPRGTSYGTKFVTCSIKQMGDGSLGAHSAVLRGSYLNDPSAKGVLVHTDEEMHRLIHIAHEGGYPTIVHCIGDGVVDQVLEGFEKAQEKTPMPDIRHGVVHCQIMGTDQLHRMRRSNVLAYVQPIFCRTDCAIADDCVGSELTRQSYDWRTMADLGLHICGGSDCPVEPCDPIPNIYYAVTRSDDKGGSWYPENGVSLEQALRMFTIEGAYAGYSEATRGSILPGKYADFVVLDRNLLEIEPEDIINTKVLMTVVEGKTVYEAQLSS